MPWQVQENPKQQRDEIVMTEIDNVLTLADALERLNKTLAAICRLKIEWFDQEIARAVAIPAHYGYEILDCEAVAKSSVASLLSPTTRSAVARMLGDVYRVELIDSSAQAEQLMRDFARHWRELDPLLASDIRMAKGSDGVATGL